VDGGRSPGGVNVIFTPHLLPINRGMLSALYFRLTPEAAKIDWQAAFTSRFEGEPFVKVLPKGQTATIAHVARTNLCALSIHPMGGALGDRLLVISCIDNLTKGAAGQALYINPRRSRVIACERTHLPRQDRVLPGAHRTGRGRCRETEDLVDDA